MKQKSFLKLFAFLLAIVMLLPTLAACDGEGETTTPPPTNGNETPNVGSNTDELGDEYLILAKEEVTSFSLVFSEQALVLTKSEATLLAQDITAYTGAELSIIEGEGNYTKNEILVGVVGTMGRPELEEFAAQYNLGLDDYIIKVVGDDLIIACGSKEASAAALQFLQLRLLYIDKDARIVAVRKDLDYLMRFENQSDWQGLSKVQVDAMAENELLFTLHPNSEKDVPCRISYNKVGGWRVQTKYSMVEPFNEIGAAQLLKVSLGEDIVTDTEKLTYWQEGSNIIAQAPDKSYVVLNTETFSVKFCYADGTICRTLTKLDHTISTGDLSLSMAFTLDNTEAIYGSGERFDSVNHRGKEVILQSGADSDSVSNSGVSVPLFISSRGSGLFLNNNGYTVADVGLSKKNELKLTLSSGSIDCYVFITEDMKEVANAYAEISGYATMPENWTQGLLVCKYASGINTYEEVVETIAKTEAYGISWTGIVVDGWDISDFSRHDELKKICDLAHSLGKKVICNVAVGLMPNTDAMPEELQLTNAEIEGFLLGWTFTYRYTEGKGGSWVNSAFQTTTTQNIPLLPKAGDMITSPFFATAPVTTSNPATCNPFLVKLDTGKRGDMTDDTLYETRTYIDITNPVAVEWFFDTYWSYLVEEIGVDGAKIIGGNMLPDVLGTLNFYNSDIPSGGARAWYPTYFGACINQVLEKKQDSGVCFMSGGGIGSQRNTYLFGGEQSRTVNRLERQLRGLISAGLSGIPFLTYDIGGSFYKNDAEMDIDKEAKIFLRGAQFATFTAGMQTVDGSVRGPFDFAEEDPNYAYVTDLYIAYTRLHAAMNPYIEEYALEATQNGLPLARHLILAYQNDKNVQDIDDQYLFGDAFLVCPELYGKNTRRIYLPEGEWKDLFTGEIHTVGSEGKWIDYNVTIETVPVFYNTKTTSATAASVLVQMQPIIDQILEIKNR